MTGCSVCHGACTCPMTVRAPATTTRDPEHTVRAHADHAIARLITRLSLRRDALIELAVERSRDGALIYGEASYAKSPDELDVETDEELGDAIFYQGARLEVLAEGAS